jgi:hypothetical protein
VLFYPRRTLSHYHLFPSSQHCPLFFTARSFPSCTTQRASVNLLSSSAIRINTKKKKMYTGYHILLFSLVMLQVLAKPLRMRRVEKSTAPGTACHSSHKENKDSQVLGRIYRGKATTWVGMIKSPLPIPCFLLINFQWNRRVHILIHLWFYHFYPVIRTPAGLPES